jgi:hypothetical protein
MNHSESWITSTGWLGTYLGGPSVTPYIMQWGQNPFYETVATYADFIYPGVGASESQHRLTIAVIGWDDVDKQRFVGCQIIGAMPSEGLQEALESLIDLWEFYYKQTMLQVQPPPRLPRKMQATIVGHKKRPDLVISR